MSRITRYDMEDGAIQEELRPFLQARTEHFLHEFLCFAKSPFNMEAYDQHAVYDCPAPSLNEGNSSSNSSVIAISEDEEDSVDLDPPGNSTSTLSHSVWDDETPGPSYSTTAEQSTADCLSLSDSDSSLEDETQDCEDSPQQMSPDTQTDVTQCEVNNEERCDDSDDCVIVSFIKPTSDRTPELVQLSSDSEESASEDTKEGLPLPQHIRFSSLSPIVSQSSDPSCTGGSENIETTDHCQKLNSKERFGSSTSSRHKASSRMDRKHTDRRNDYDDRSVQRLRSKDIEHRRRRSRSGERRSPGISNSSVSALSRERVYSYSRNKYLYSKGDSNNKRRDSDHDSKSYRHYSQERNDRGSHYRERMSVYYSSCKYSDRRSHSPSRSRSRDLRGRDRRHSRSRTYSSSRSPSAKRGHHHHNKPGGKRKNKTRHLEEPSKSTLSNSGAEGDLATTKPKKKNKEKHHKKSKHSSRKTSRSLSVELVNEENSLDRSKRHHKKKKHKKKSKRHKSSERTEKHSPTVITIESDSDSIPNEIVTQSSSTSEDNHVDNTTDDPVDAVDPAPPHSDG